MHLLLPAPEFEARSEADLVRAALQDSSRRIISMIGARGVDKTALVHRVLTETKTAAFVWRFDLNPDIRDLLEGLSLHVGRRVDNMQALGGLPQEPLIVVDGVQEWALQRCGEASQGYALADLVQAIRCSESGARLLLVSRPVPGLELCHSSERILVTPPGRLWLERRLSSVKVRGDSELGLFALMTDSVRAFEQVLAVLAVLVRSTKDVPLWLKECSRDHQALLQSVLTRADPDVQAAAVVLAAMPSAIRAESLLGLHGEVGQRDWGAAIDQLVQLRLLCCAEVQGQRWYELDPLVRPALTAIECEQSYLPRFLLVERQIAEAESGGGQPADRLRAAIDAEDIVGAQFWYGQLRRGVQRVAPSATTASLATALSRQWGVRFQHWENDQSPAFDRAVSQIMRGEPKRAEAGLLSLRAQFSSLGDSLQPGGAASGRGIALDEALIDAIVAQGDLWRAGSETSQALSRADGLAVDGLLLRRARIKALLGQSQAATVELQRLSSVVPARGRGANQVCLAQHMYRLGKVQSAMRLVRGAPDSGLLRARADLVLADVMRSLCEYARATEHAVSAHAYAHSDGLIALQAQSLISRARICCAQGDLQNAVPLAAEAAQVATDAGYGLEYLDASIVGARAGDNSVGLPTILRLARQSAYGWALSAVLQLCAERHLEQGERAEALLRAEEALSLREAMQDPKLANTRAVLNSARRLSGPRQGE